MSNVLKTFSTKPMFLWKKSWLFGLFSGDKGDYSDVLMIKIMTRTNQIDKDVCFFQKNIIFKNHVCPYSLAFFY